jgi:hypothetical protein
VLTRGREREAKEARSKAAFLEGKTSLELLGLEAEAKRLGYP